MRPFVGSEEGLGVWGKLAAVRAQHSRKCPELLTVAEEECRVAGRSPCEGCEIKRVGGLSEVQTLDARHCMLAGAEVLAVRSLPGPALPPACWGKQCRPNGTVRSAFTQAPCHPPYQLSTVTATVPGDSGVQLPKVAHGVCLCP